MNSEELFKSSGTEKWFISLRMNDGIETLERLLRFSVQGQGNLQTDYQHARRESLLLPHQLCLHLDSLAGPLPVRFM